jgi:hypothetical protein
MADDKVRISKSPMLLGALLAGLLDEEEVQLYIEDDPFDLNAAVQKVAKKKKVWMSEPPTTCQLCQKPLRGVFIDGATVYGPWAIMCRPCHVTQGRGSGTGRGQIYNLETLEKIEG